MGERGTRLLRVFAAKTNALFFSPKTLCCCRHANFRPKVSLSNEKGTNKSDRLTVELFELWTSLNNYFPLNKALFGENFQIE